MPYSILCHIVFLYELVHELEFVSDQCLLTWHWEENLFHKQLRSVFVTCTNLHVWTSGCRAENQSDMEWLEINMGPFAQSASYADLKRFNLSVVSHAFLETSSVNRVGFCHVNENKAAWVVSACVIRWQFWTSSHPNRKLSCSWTQTVVRWRMRPSLGRSSKACR